MEASQAQFLAQYMTSLWEGEFPATFKVVQAVPDGECTAIVPDEKSRTGWELVTHLAGGDIWFLQSIIDGAFTWDPEEAKKRETAFKSVKDVAAYYKTDVPGQARRSPRAVGRQADAPGGLLRDVHAAGGVVLGFANNHSMHHRGQLAAYLRAMGSKVPAIYGGSADEPMVA